MRGQCLWGLGLVLQMIKWEASVCEGWDWEQPTFPLAVPAPGRQTAPPACCPRPRSLAPLQTECPRLGFYKMQVPSARQKLGSCVGLCGPKATLKMTNETNADQDQKSNSAWTWWRSGKVSVGAGGDCPRKTGGGGGGGGRRWGRGGTVTRAWQLPRSVMCLESKPGGWCRGGSTGNPRPVPSDGPCLVCSCTMLFTLQALV